MRAFVGVCVSMCVCTRVCECVDFRVRLCACACIVEHQSLVSCKYGCGSAVAISLTIKQPFKVA